MIYFEDIHKYACSRFDMHFVGCTKFNNNISVFKLPFKHQIIYLAKILHEHLLCPDFFIALHWITFFIAIIGLWEACNEIIRVFQDPSYDPKTFGNRTYDYVTMKFRQRARICGQSLNAKLFMCLIYGLFRLRTSYILPWIVVYGIVILMEIIYWICNIIKNRNWRIDSIKWLFILSIRWVLTLHMMVAMDKYRNLK
ncbi:hypothetical protein PVAND_007929 [Polypedilum vanderplanki]|uniref:Uncharacterized protein n=1 Tax=Polypedilum vanderplanki TaxID=319348 RepID=A0A9J6C8H5_POLVA|nr:hypothetical protein PVAND_007929 [Polypedilum vanderplanki]